jgi:hypothetical protein
MKDEDKLIRFWGCWFVVVALTSLIIVGVILWAVIKIVSHYT